MKKLLALAAFGLFSSSAGAATVTVSCSLILNAVPPQSGSANTSCAGLSSVIPSGSTINYVNMVYTFDFTFSDMQSGTREVTFGADAPGTTFDLSGILVSQGTRPVTGTVNGTAADYPLLASPFTVSGTWSAITPPVTGVTIDFKFEAGYSPVPEPATLGLIGASLLGIGLLRRRFI